MAKKEFEPFTIINFNLNGFVQGFIERTVCNETKTKWICTDGREIDKNEFFWKRLTKELEAMKMQYLSARKVICLRNKLPSLNEIELLNLCKDPAFVNAIETLAKIIEK